MLRHLFYLFLFVPLLLVAGCKGGSPSAPSSSDTTTPAPTQPAAPTGAAFGPGTHRVGEDITPRQYFSDPSDGCYWERLSGFGGTVNEILANRFIGFDSRQEIVRIRQTDLAFSADAECSDWFTTRRHGRQADIPPGTWLVGEQVAPGTYSTGASPGCYWERLRNFTGEIGDVIANDFVGGGGRQLVTIVGSDSGFSTDGDCGTWTRTDTLITGEEPSRTPLSPADIEDNWMRNREQERFGRR